jgi:hypothetical protein
MGKCLCELRLQHYWVEGTQHVQGLVFQLYAWEKPWMETPTRGSRTDP